MSGNDSVGNELRSFGRAHLQSQLQRSGLSRRKALQVLNAVFEAMGKGLRQDGEVEFPLGKLKVVPHHHREQEGIFLGRKRVIYRRRYTIVHELDEIGDELLNSPPPPQPKRTLLALPPKPWKKEEQKPVPKTITARGRLNRRASVVNRASEPEVKPRFAFPPRLSRKPAGPLQKALARLADLELSHRSR